MRAKARQSPVEGFQPLAELVLSITPEKRHAWRERLESLDRSKVLEVFGKAFAAGARAPASRKAAFLIANSLVQLGIPPCFWRTHLSKPIDELQVSQRFDLLVFDLLWLRRWYPDHANNNRYQRYRVLFGPSESKFHHEAAYAFYEGRRRAWEIVRSLGLDKAQQWECAWLRSVPINRQQAATDAMRDRVFASLHDDLKSARKTAAFTDDDARVSLRRRHDIWLCSRMDAAKSPTQLAARYEQLTGQIITRQAAAKQLGKVREVLAQDEMTYAA
jgi:hypothetical protein